MESSIIAFCLLLKKYFNIGILSELYLILFFFKYLQVNSLHDMDLILHFPFIKFLHKPLFLPLFQLVSYVQVKLFE